MTILDFYSKLGLKYHKDSPGKFKGPCPSCGGKDRFTMEPNYQTSQCLGTYICNQCKLRGNTLSFLMSFLHLDLISSSEEIVKSDLLGNAPFPKIIKEGRAMTSPKVNTTNTPQSTTKPLESPVLVYNELWGVYIEALANKATRELEKQSSVWAYLNKRGIDDPTIDEFKIGYIPQDAWIDKGLVGLAQDLWVPKGIFIPIWEGDKIIRVKIKTFPDDPTRRRFYLLKGSCLKHVIGDKERVILVESELDAYLLHSYVKEHADIIALGCNNITQKERLALELKGKQVFVCYDNDDAGKSLRQEVISLFPEATSFKVPKGKDPGECMAHDYPLGDYLLYKLIN